MGDLMFTGIVTAIGSILATEQRGDLRARISMPWDPDQVDVGASLCCNGICLTAVNRGQGPDRNWFEADLSAETVARTHVGLDATRWKIGSRINLERSLRVGDELGGHILSGHVDGVAFVSGVTSSGGSRIVRMSAPDELMRFIAPKGSVALNGTSLTVNSVSTGEFDICLIPHTLKVTTWGGIREGDGVNVEVDLLARYVARLTEHPGYQDGPRDE